MKASPEKESNPTEQDIMQLLVQHLPALQAFVAAMMPGQPDIEDIVQETCVLIWQKQKEFKHGSNFKAWIFAIAKFKILSCWRDAKRRKVLLISEEAMNALIEQVDTNGFKSIDERKNLLTDCIEQLKVEDRALILSRYLDGSGIEQLAAAQKRSNASIRVSLHRIRRVLRTCIEMKMRRKDALS